MSQDLTSEKMKAIYKRQPPVRKGWIAWKKRTIKQLLLPKAVPLLPPLAQETVWDKTLHFLGALESGD